MGGIYTACSHVRNRWTLPPKTWICVYRDSFKPVPTAAINNFRHSFRDGCAICSVDVGTEYFKQFLYTSGCSGHVQMETLH
jgi:hypothetical protein